MKRYSHNAPYRQISNILYPIWKILMRDSPHPNPCPPLPSRPLGGRPQHGVGCGGGEPSWAYFHISHMIFDLCIHIYIYTYICIYIYIHIYRERVREIEKELNLGDKSVHLVGGISQNHRINMYRTYCTSCTYRTICT